MRHRIGILSFMVSFMAGLIVMVSTAIAQDKLPDLIPVVVNANQGSVEIRNIGDAAAKPGRVFVVCSRIPLKSKHSVQCAKGLHLRGFIEKWNTLPYDVPALQPDDKFLFHVFGSGAFPRRPGVYGMTITIDPLKQITESNESNNYTRLDTVIRVEKTFNAYTSAKWQHHIPTTTSKGEGFLHLRILMNGKPVPFEIGWTSPARGFLSEQNLYLSETEKPIAPLSGTNTQPMKLRVGIYDLKVHERAVGGQDIVIKGIDVRKGEIVERTVEIDQPGELDIMARWTHQPLNILACAKFNNPVNFGRLGALMGGGSGAGGRSRGDCLDPNVHLAARVSSPGRNDGDIAKTVYLTGKTNKATGDNIGFINIKASVYDIAFWPVGHPELEQTLKDVRIMSGEVTQRKLMFRWSGKKK